MPHIPYGTSEDRTDQGAAHEITKPPISHYLRQGGYQCFYGGKWHLGADNVHKWFDRYAACEQDERDYTQWCKLHGIPDGFIFHDPQRDKPYRSVHPPRMSIPRTGVLDIPDDKEHNFWILSHAVELLGWRDPDRPLFMVASMEGPHPPLVVPQKYYDMYDPADVPVPDNWDPPVGEPSFLADSYYRRLRNEWGDDFDNWRKSIAVYWGYATYIDSLFNRFLERLEDNDLLNENTLLAIVSDHGEMFGQHGLWQKFCPYEEAMRVPWVMSWPGVIKPGTRCAMDVSHPDLAATLLAAGGIDPAALGLEGEDLLPYIRGQRPQPESRDCFCQYNLAPDFRSWHGVENWRTIIRRPWKYTLHANGEREMYNLLDDPGEMKNCATQATHQAVHRNLHNALLDWCRRTGDPFTHEPGDPVT